MKKQAYNPYLPGYEYIPDGEPYVFGDRVYVYGSHDRFGGKAYCENDYVCWSADINDLGNWKYEGVIYKKSQDPCAKDTNCMYAPDMAVGADGRYYLYYGLDITATMAVAVADNPVGPFEYYGRVHDKDGRIWGEADGDIYQFDPGVLVDDDGKVWLYTGFGAKDPEERRIKIFGNKEQKGGYVVELEKDMLTMKGEPKLIIPQLHGSEGTPFEDHPFFEASSIRKINGIYYFVYSSSNMHELCYATSKYPDRDFIPGGPIISNGDIGLDGYTMENSANYWGNNHGGMVEINGQWYIFYHRHTNYSRFSRQDCAEPITIEKDGSIKQVEMTSCGLNGGALRGIGTYPARIACHLHTDGHTGGMVQTEKVRTMHPSFTQLGEDREENDNQYIKNLINGCVAGFRYFDLTDTKEISVELKGASGTVEVYDKIGGNKLSEVKFEATEEYKNFSAALNGGDKKSGLFFVFRTEGSVDFNSFTLA